MSNKDLNTEDILNLWVKVSGVSPDMSCGTSSDFRMRESHKEIAEALLLDPTEVTAVLMLKNIFKQFAEDLSVSVSDILSEKSSVSSLIDDMRQLNNMLDAPTIEVVTNDFLNNLKDRLDFYGFSQEYKDYVSDNSDVAFLKRDALKSISETLYIDQFKTGEYEDPDVQPVYVKSIHMFWNMSSLLTSCLNMPSGVSLNLIKSPVTHDSYFAFAIRNGENIYILSDRSQAAHPLSSKMTRRPERRVEERSFQNWFPYDLLGLEWGDDGKPYLNSDIGNGMVPINDVAVAIKEINQLDKNEAIWVVLMLDEIVNKFWFEKHQEKEISYTNDIISICADKHRGIENLPQTISNLPELPPLTLSDVMSDDLLGSDALGETGSSVNKWLEDRFIDQLDDSLLNHVNEHGVLAISKDSGDIVEKTESATTVHCIDSKGFGTLNEIKNNRLFLARYNVAKRVGDLAEREFDETLIEVRTWVAKRAAANINNILKALKGVPDKAYEWGKYSKDTPKEGFGLFSYITDPDRDSSTSGFIAHQYYKKCMFTGAKASFLLKVMPRNAGDLSLMCGCNVSDLPDVLQNWTLEPMETRNPILQRVDPMLWVLKNPWNKICLDFNVAISKRSFGKLKKGMLIDIPDAAQLGGAGIGMVHHEKGYCINTLELIE